MKTVFILTVIFFVMIIQIITHSSARCEQHKNNKKPGIPLMIAKSPDDDMIKNRTDKGDLAEIDEAEMTVQDNASDHFNRGVAHDNSGMYSEAIGSYKRAIMIKPDYSEAYYNLAISYLMSNDVKSAHDEYMLLKEISPQKADDLYNKALLMVRSNPDNKYVIQVGAFRNIQNANNMIDKLRANYMHAQIEEEDGYSKVRMFGFKSKEEAAIMMKDISDKFRPGPFLVPGR
jgi:tetratricopeptide (TPR) repeat protein